MPSSSNSIITHYNRMVIDGDLHTDDAQKHALTLLAAFGERLDGYRPRRRPLLSFVLGRPTAAPTRAGLYLYGDVGRGKSMLMDLFFAHVNVAKKRRVHFHQFMLEIHERLHGLQITGGVDDVLPALARSIAKETWLLCFDEFHVSNIADAMILGRLFSVLFEAGVIIVTTSNWAPDDLYKNGLQRDRFLPFIELIKRKMIVHKLDGDTDHRYEKLSQHDSYFSPLSEATTHKLQGVFMHLTEEAVPESLTLPVQGRSLKIVHAAKGVGFFNFEELCVNPLGSADFLAIAECLHTVVIDGVPKFKMEQRNETLRFMTLIDSLYEAKVKLFMGSEAPPEKLAPLGDLATTFQRTVSRLMEMQGDEYRQQPHLAA